MVCLRHVDHTHKQLDNAPCPDLELRYIETQEVGCGHERGRQECKTETTYAFEPWTDRRYKACDWRFCEERLPGEKHECENGSWMMGRDHSCGIGREEYQWWRHRTAEEEIRVEEKPKEEKPKEQKANKKTRKVIKKETKKENVKPKPAAKTKREDTPQLKVQFADSASADLEMEEGIEKLKIEDSMEDGNKDVGDQRDAKKVKLGKGKVQLEKRVGNN